MRFESSPRCRAPLLAFVAALACGPALGAEPPLFNGRWLADDPDQAQGPYAVLAIDDATLSWRPPKRSAPTCTRRFELHKERPGTVYVDGRGKKFVAGVPGSIPTYLLKLGDGTCGSPADAVRINFPLIYDRRHIEFIEYVGGKPVSVQRLHRKK
jgi:hypothetical protein